MSELTYRGACHCEAVQFEASLDLDNTFVCNCSRCQKLGWVFAFAPRAKVVLTRGEGATREYRFQNRRIRRQFCEEFGIGKEGGEMAVINVNYLDSVDPRALSPKSVDGRSL